MLSIDVWYRIIFGQDTTIWISGIWGWNINIYLKYNFPERKCTDALDYSIHHSNRNISSCFFLVLSILTFLHTKCPEKFYNKWVILRTLLSLSSSPLCHVTFSCKTHFPRELEKPERLTSYEAASFCRSIECYTIRYICTIRTSCWVSGTIW